MTETEELEFEVDFTSSMLNALMIHNKLREIANVADVLFEPSLTSPNYTGTFADGQRISFNPYTVDWEQLERTCRFWSRKYLWREFAKFLDSDLLKRTTEALKKTK